MDLDLFAVLTSIASACKQISALVSSEWDELLLYLCFSNISLVGYRCEQLPQRACWVKQTTQMQAEMSKRSLM